MSTLLITSKIIAGNGSVKVQMFPEATDSTQIMALLYCYLAKVYWLSLTEENVMPTLDNVFNLSLKNWPNETPVEMMSSLYPNESIYDVSLHKSKGSDNYYVVNNLPSKSYSLDLVTQYFFLQNHILKKLPREFALAQKSSFQSFYKELGVSCVSEDVSGLNAGYNLANKHISKIVEMGDGPSLDTGRLFCKAPGCGAPHMPCDAGTARAILQAQLRTNPNQKYTFDCERCSKTTAYSYSEIMQRIPVEKRPKPCPEGEFWAFVLLEIPTSDKMLDRAFFGEPVRLRLAREISGDWYAKLVTPTRFLQGCLPSDLLVGYRVGRFNICSQLFRENQLLALPLVSGIPQDSEFALFFQAKKDNTSGFRSGTLFCANPSCVYPFQLTHTQFIAKSPTATQLAQDPDASCMILLTCPKCGTVRQVDEKSFENIVRI